MLIRTIAIAVRINYNMYNLFAYAGIPTKIVYDLVLIESSDETQLIHMQFSNVSNKKIISYLISQESVRFLQHKS